MAFITGLFLIDAPASALNNSGDPIQNARTQNTSATKYIRTRQGNYPYVSAQAFRYWLRHTLMHYADIPWEMSPLAREAKVAYTDANPIDWWDDDLLGYMRAPSTRKDRDIDLPTPVESSAVTRVSPFRVSTLVSIAPVMITDDFGVMARQEGDPVPFEHQFYRTTLKGLFSLDLRSVGTFTASERSGYQNLDNVRVALAQERGLEQVDPITYRLPLGQRIERVQSLLYAMPRLMGGAKQATHYTDVSPAFVIAAVTHGGNHIFGRIITEDGGLPIIHEAAFDQAFNVLQSDIHSSVHIGRAEGFMDSSQPILDSHGFAAIHPRQALDNLAAEIAQHPEWWE